MGNIEDIMCLYSVTITIFLLNEAETANFTLSRDVLMQDWQRPKVITGHRINRGGDCRKNIGASL
jgi:hypothetical protein